MLFVSAMRQGPSVSVCEKPTRSFFAPPPSAPPPPPSCLRQPANVNAASAKASVKQKTPRRLLLSDFMFYSPGWLFDEFLKTLTRGLDAQRLEADGHSQRAA